MNDSPFFSLGSASLPLLFLDDGGLEQSRGLERSFHPARTRSQPVLTADRSWERGRIYLYGSVERRDDGFRMWYSTPKPSELAFAVSPDGLHWEKPALGVIPRENVPDHNLVYPDAHSPSIYRDPFDAPDRRYKLLSKSRSGGAQANCSSDGIHWGTPVPAFPSDDTLTLTQHPLTGEFFAYHKKQTMVRGYLRRTVWLSRSADFQTWSPAEPVFAPDPEDDAWAQSGERTDVYNLSVFPHATGFAGFPTLFRVLRSLPAPEETPTKSPDDGPIDVQLITSSNGIHWHRPASRIAMIPRGVHGNFDQGAIMGLCNTPVHTDTESWMYYTALNTGHGAPIPPKQASLGRAEWRLHGFASLFAGNETGCLETKPLRLLSPFLRANVQAGEGRLRVAVHERDGAPIAGYTMDDCVPVEGDQLRGRIAWKHRNELPTDRPVRLHLELRNSRLFSIFCADKNP